MDHEQLKRMGKAVRLVITDMDGTLLTSGQLITKRTKEAICSLARTGKGFTVCTGRIPAMATAYIKDLALSMPVVAANGAVIWDPLKGKPLFEKALPPDCAETIADYCMEHQLDYCILTLESSYFPFNSIRINKFRRYNRIAEEQGNPQMKLKYLQRETSCPTGERIYKILIDEPNPQQYERIGEFLKNLSGIQLTRSDQWLWDISASGVSKGTGLAFVKDYLGLKTDEICAFGDYENDIPMLAQAGFPVAMKNGCDTIKSKAVYVTESNDEDGVAAVIERFL